MISVQLGSDGGSCVMGNGYGRVTGVSCIRWYKHGATALVLLQWRIGAFSIFQCLYEKGVYKNVQQSRYEYEFRRARESN